MARTDLLILRSNAKRCVSKDAHRMSSSTCMALIYQIGAWDKRTYPF
jgi:hypothetical protein